MMTTCGICGKRFVVTWPQHWVYRRKDVYLCGEDCMIVYDTQCTRAANGFGAKKKEGADEDMALTQKQKNEAVEIAIQGGSPIEYLKKCGLKNPYCAWGCIKKNLEKNDLGKYVKLISMSADKPAKVEKVDKVPDVKPEPAPLAPMPMVLQGGVDYQLKVDEAKKKPGFAYSITGIDTEIGEFMRVSAGKIKWCPGNMAKEDRIMEIWSMTTEPALTIEQWQKLVEVIPEVLRVLGGKTE